MFNVFNLLYPNTIIHEKKTLKELVRLKRMLYDKTDEDAIKEIEDRIKLCEALSWKDYKTFYK